MSIDLSTNYGSLRLCSPIVVGSCLLTAEGPTQVAIVSAGAGAIVLPSIFQEQVFVEQPKRAHGVGTGTGIAETKQAISAGERGF